MTYSELLVQLGLEIKKRRLNYCRAKVVTFQNGEALVSYSTMVAAKINNKYYFTAKHDCSQTTNYHVRAWCRLGAPERRTMIQSGEATLVEKSNTNFWYA